MVLKACLLFRLQSSESSLFYYLILWWRLASVFLGLELWRKCKLFSWFVFCCCLGNIYSNTGMGSPMILFLHNQICNFQIRGNRITFTCVLLVSGIGALLEQVLLSDFPYILYIFLFKSCLRILFRYAHWNALS